MILLINVVNRVRKNSMSIVEIFGLLIFLTSVASAITLLSLFFRVKSVAWILLILAIFIIPLLESIFRVFHDFYKIEFPALLYPSFILLQQLVAFGAFLFLHTTFRRNSQD
jgi:hypothetical protein